MSTLTVDEVSQRIKKGAPITGMVSFDDDEAPEEIEETLTGTKLTPNQMAELAED
jgi:hypothetical protein